MGARIAERRSRAASISRFMGSLALPVLVLGAVGHRSGMVPTEALIGVLILGFALAAAALGTAVYALVDIWQTGVGGAGKAFAGLIYIAPVLLLLGLSLYAIAAYAPVNDVSTDPEAPPDFAVLAVPPAPFPGENVALQRSAYPEIAARIYPVQIRRAYRVAEMLVAERGWEVAWASAPLELDVEARIEAVARTPIFAFADDVLILFAATEEGTRVDMRSVSRIGEHDLGQNARRIRAFLDDLDFALQGALDVDQSESEDAPAASAPSDLPADAAPPEAGL